MHREYERTIAKRQIEQAAAVMTWSFVCPHVTRLKSQNNVAAGEMGLFDTCNLQCFDAIHDKQIITNQIKSSKQHIARARGAKKKDAHPAYRSQIK